MSRIEEIRKELTEDQKPFFEELKPLLEALADMSSNESGFANLLLLTARAMTRQNLTMEESLQPNMWFSLLRGIVAMQIAFGKLVDSLEAAEVGLITKKPDPTDTLEDLKAQAKQFPEEARDLASHSFQAGVALSSQLSRALVGAVVVEMSINLVGIWPEMLQFVVKTLKTRVGLVELPEWLQSLVDLAQEVKPFKDRDAIYTAAHDFVTSQKRDPKIEKAIREVLRYAKDKSH